MKKIRKLIWWLGLAMLLGAYGFTLKVDVDLKSRIYADARLLESSMPTPNLDRPDLKNHRINCATIGVSWFPAMTLILYLSSTLAYAYWKRTKAA